MPTNTYVPLGTITLASTDSEIVFSNIGAGYRDLVLVCNARSTYSADPADDLVVQFNGDTGSNYSCVIMYGQGSQALSFTATNARVGHLETSNGGFTGYGTQIAQIQDYSATDKHKTFLGRTASQGFVYASAARWASTTAVNSVRLITGRAASFAIGSTFSLYGVN